MILLDFGNMVNAALYNSPAVRMSWMRTRFGSTC